MAFVLPTFNLSAGIYDNPFPGFGAPRVITDCQLRAPNMGTGGLGSGSVAVTQTIMLLMPPGTDIKDPYTTPINDADFVEVPLGSHCLYQVLYVNDIGKGFPNEHRYAVLAKSGAGGGWPDPIP